MKQLVADFENGKLVPPFSMYQGAVGSLNIVDSTVIQPRAGKHCLHHHVSDNDIHAAEMPGAAGVNRSHPSSNVIYQDGMVEGDDFCCQFSYHIPLGQPGTPGGRFPFIDGNNRAKPHPEGQWFLLSELFGPPFTESPPIGIDIEGNPKTHANDLVIKGNANEKYAVLLRVPLTYDQWHDIGLHCHVSSSSSKGFLEVLHDGQPIAFVNGKDRFYMPTIDSGSKTANVYVAQYRCLGLGTIDTYSDEVRVGPTWASVQCPTPLGADPLDAGPEMHTKGGFHFTRLRDGSVKVRFALPAQPPYYPEPQTIREMTLSESDWASIVARVGRSGETAESYQAVLDLHRRGLVSIPAENEVEA